MSEPRGNTSDAVLRLLAPIFEPGSHPFPIMEYRAEVIETRAGCFCLVVDEKDLPRISIAVAEDRIAAELLWTDLVRFYQIMKTWNGTAPVSTTSLFQPTSQPWYATMEIFTEPSDTGFLKEFARHFAWGWIDQHGRRGIRPAWQRW